MFRPTLLVLMVALCWSVAAQTTNQATDPLPASTPALLQRFERQEPHMGTLFRIKLYAPDEASANAAFARAFARIKALDDCMSDYKATSELSQFSKSAGGPARKLSDDLFEILLLSERLSQKTSGAFDVTVGPIVKQWRHARRIAVLPSPEKVTETQKLIGFQLLKLDIPKQTGQLERAGMLLDLGGIAKGFACDCAARELRAAGINIAMIDGGGGITAIGAPPGEPGWKISLPDPGQSIDQVNRLLVLKNQSVHTSGDREQFVTIDGVRYSHIVDPNKGLGRTRSMQATIVCNWPEQSVPLVERLADQKLLIQQNPGGTADALATACCLLDPKQSLQVFDGLPAVAARIAYPADHANTTSKGDPANHSVTWQIRESSKWSNLTIITKP